jgi:hypothetical protein
LERTGTDARRPTQARDDRNSSVAKAFIGSEARLLTNAFARVGLVGMALIAESVRVRRVLKACG